MVTIDIVRFSIHTHSSARPPPWPGGQAFLSSDARPRRLVEKFPGYRQVAAHGISLVCPQHLAVVAVSSFTNGFSGPAPVQNWYFPACALSGFTSASAPAVIDTDG